MGSVCGPHCGNVWAIAQAHALCGACVLIIPHVEQLSDVRAAAKASLCFTWLLNMRMNCGHIRSWSGVAISDLYKVLMQWDGCMFRHCASVEATVQP
jgi:hypothetical protein